jgi:hypothetical protein
MKSQGMQENQQVVFMSDGGEDVRQVQEYLHPNSEHVIDWFPLTMRLTVLQQQTKALQAERPDEGVAASKQIESVKHLLWHGNWDEALDRIDSLFIDGDLIRRPSDPADQLAVGIADLRTYIRPFRSAFGTSILANNTVRVGSVPSTQTSITDPAGRSTNRSPMETFCRRSMRPDRIGATSTFLTIAISRHAPESPITPEAPAVQW